MIWQERQLNGDMWTKGPFGPPLAWSKTTFWTKIAKFDEFGPAIYKNCDFKNVKFWRFNTEAKSSFFENGGFNVCASQFFHLLNYYTHLKYLLIDQKPRSRYISKKKKKPSLFLLCSFYYTVPLTVGLKNFNPRFFPAHLLQKSQVSKRNYSSISGWSSHINYWIVFVYFMTL